MTPTEPLPLEIEPRDLAAWLAHDRPSAILDVREAHELAESGEVADAGHIPRGFLEATADPTAQSAHPPLTRAHGGETPVYVLCASGARAALAAKQREIEELQGELERLEALVEADREATSPGVPAAA